MTNQRPVCPAEPDQWQPRPESSFPALVGEILVNAYLYYSPQAPDRFNPKVTVNTCGIIQKLYETKHIETMTFVKSVMGHFSKIEPKTSKKDLKNG